MCVCTMCIYMYIRMFVRTYVYSAVSVVCLVIICPHIQYSKVAAKGLLPPPDSVNTVFPLKIRPSKVSTPVVEVSKCL